MRIQIPVAVLEFEEGGNTIWVQGPEGATVLRIKVQGKIQTSRCTTSPVSHLDLRSVEKDPTFCLGPEAEEDR